MEAFWFSLAMVFIAELGDKTQLVALCMAARYKAGVVLAGVFVATLAVHLVSVALGGVACRFMPKDWCTFLAGVAFIVFGLWTLRGDSLEEDEATCTKQRSPFWLVTITFFLAELGDKTMITTVTIASTHSWLPVWLGSTTGMVLSDGLAILVGQVMGTKLPERAVKIGAAIIFFAFGAWSLVTGAVKLPMYAWPIGIVVPAALAFLFFRGSRPDQKAVEPQKQVE